MIVVVVEGPPRHLKAIPLRTLPPGRPVNPGYGAASVASVFAESVGPVSLVVVVEVFAAPGLQRPRQLQRNHWLESLLGKKEQQVKQVVEGHERRMDLI